MHRFITMLLAAVIFNITNPTLCSAQESASKPEAATISTKTEILNTLRHWIKSWADTDITLTVEHLGVKNGWAWVETVPHYADGKKHEPRIDALLRKSDGKWQVEFVADNDDGLKGEERPQKDHILQRFLKPPYGSAPLEIFQHKGNKQ